VYCVGRPLACKNSLLKQATAVCGPSLDFLFLDAGKHATPDRGWVVKEGGGVK